MNQDPETMRAALRPVFAEIARRQVRDDQCIVSTGIIDSLSVLNLVSRIEQALGIEIPKQQVQPEDFDSVDVTLETLHRLSET